MVILTTKTKKKLCNSLQIELIEKILVSFKARQMQESLSQPLLITYSKSCMPVAQKYYHTVHVCERVVFEAVKKFILKKLNRITSNKH